MEFIKKTIFIPLLFVIYMCTNIYALNLGNNITISDQNFNNSKEWYSNREDQEVEPNCIAKQEWDLEGFFLNEFTLTTVGGFDFINGQEGYKSGDIFIDTNLDAKYAQDSISTSANGYISYFYDYGYEYAISLDFSNLIYNVYQIDKTQNTLISAYYRQNDLSSPWKYAPLSNQQPIYTGKISYYTSLTDADTGFLGGTHNAFSIALSFLPENTEFIAHFTIGCGNDNLMGQGIAHAPEPATLFLFGTGLVGFAAITRKKKLFK